MAAAELNDAQTKQTGKTLIKNLESDSLQRIQLNALADPEGTQKAGRDKIYKMSKGGTVMHVVFSSSVPESLKAEPLVLLLSRQEVKGEVPQDLAPGGLAAAT